MLLTVQSTYITFEKGRQGYEGDNYGTSLIRAKDLFLVYLPKGDKCNLNIHSMSALCKNAFWFLGVTQLWWITVITREADCDSLDGLL